MTARVLNDWADSLSTRDPDRIVAHYAPDALLLATLDRKPLVGRAQIKTYFNELVKKRGLGVSFGQTREVRPGIWAGLYTFVWDGGSLPARFTIVVGPRGIQHQHSCSLPPV